MRVLRGHRRDIWGIGFVVLGLVTALGVYWGAAGPIGNGLSQLFDGVVGLLRAAPPIVFAGTTVNVRSPMIMPVIIDI